MTLTGLTHPDISWNSNEIMTIAAARSLKMG